MTKPNENCAEIEGRLHDMPDILHAIKRAEERRYDAYGELKSLVEQAYDLVEIGHQEDAKAVLRQLALQLLLNMEEVGRACSDFDILSSLRKKEKEWGPFDDG